jgi:hypothetical protein
MSLIKVRPFVVVAVLFSVWTGLGWAQTLRVVGFNGESGGARPDVVDDLTAGVQGKPGQLRLCWLSRSGQSIIHRRMCHQRHSLGFSGPQTTDTTRLFRAFLT